MDVKVNTSAHHHMRIYIYACIYIYIYKYICSLDASPTLLSASVAALV